MRRRWHTLLLVCAACNGGTAAAAAFRAYANVVNVQPIVETFYKPVTRQVCSDPDGAANALAPLAGTIGDDIREQRRLWHAQRSCEFITEQQPRERVTGYRVTYRYRGYTSTTRLSYHPGDRMPVNVNLSPLR